MKPKQMIVIVGPNGVGKSTTAQALVQLRPGSACVEGDWFCAVNPFPPTESVRKAVEDNLFCLFRNYLRCEDIDLVVFPYALHGNRSQIFYNLMTRLKQEGLNFQLHMVVLKCTCEENIRRARLDGREEGRIQRGMKNTFQFYDAYEYPMIDTTALQPGEVAGKILELFGISKV